MRLDEIYEQVGKDLSIHKDVIKAAYSTQYQFIRDTISKIPCKTISSEDELNKYKISFNVPSLGKFYTTWNRIVGQRKRKEFLDKLFLKDGIKENTANVYKDIDDDEYI